MVLVKGNPVEIRSYTRSCKSIYASVIYCHCPRWGGKVTARADKPENLPLIYYVSINNASGEGLLTLVYMQRFFGAAALCTICMWLCGAHICRAQQVDTLSQVRNLAEIEVVSDAVDAVPLSATPVQAVRGSDIERLGYTTAADALKRMAGVQVQDYGGIGGLKTVSVRGLGAKHTAVSYDGVAVSDAYSGQIDIGRYALDNVELLSLTVGQGNDIFRTARSFASAGFLEIKSRRPLATRIVAKARAGSFGLLGAVLLRERIFGRHWSYSAHLNVQRADGDYPFTLVNGSQSSRLHRADGDTKSIAAEGNLFGDFGNRGNVQMKVAYYDSERGLPGSVRLYNKDNSERLWDNNFYVQATGELALSAKWRARAVAKYNYLFSRYKQVNKNFAAGYQTDANTQNEYYASVATHYTMGGGFSFSLTSDLSFATVRNNFLAGREPQRINSQTVLAASYERGSVTATASLLGTLLADDAGGSSKTNNKKRLSPAVSFAWQPLENVPLRLRASYNDIFRTPTLADLYYQRMGNVGLKPERATQYNVGATYSGSLGSKLSVAISIDGYYNRVKDKIVALPTMYIWRMQNYGRVYVKGVDATLSVTCSPACNVELIADASYSYSHTVDKTNRSSKNYGHQIPYTPRHTANGSLTLNNKWVNISYLVTFVGERYMLPQNIAENRLPAYTEHSVSLNREFALRGNRLLRLQGELLNFTDKSYEIIGYYPMPGRQWRLTACITF